MSLFNFCQPNNLKSVNFQPKYQPRMFEILMAKVPSAPHPPFLSLSCPSFPHHSALRAPRIFPLPLLSIHLKKAGEAPQIHLTREALAPNWQLLQWLSGV